MEVPEAAPTTADHSQHPTVVDYATQTMMRGKSPAAAARATAKSLGGVSNLFISPVDPVQIDPAKLEEALWNRLVEFTVQGMSSMKAGFEHYALDGTIAHFHQAAKIRAILKDRVIAQLGQDPFVNDDR